MDEREVLMSRPARSTPFGKCTAEVKTAVPDETKDALAGLAFEAGVPTAEYVRYVLMNHCHGYVAMVRANNSACRMKIPSPENTQE